ncbi:MAG TPA: hypothetical protein VGK73_10570 [Polyangiaceae bacterium]
MKKAIAALALALGATHSLSALADEYTTNWDKVDRVIAYENNFRVYGLNLAPNPAGCASLVSAYVDPSLSIAKKEGLNRALIAALLSGREVKVKLRSGSCHNDGVPLIYGVQTR